MKTIEIDGVKYSLTPIEPETKETPHKRWRAENGEKYWICSYAGSCRILTEENDESDLGCYNLGNYFKTEEEAKRELNYILTRQRVKDAIAELNGDWKPDWSDSEQAKYLLLYELNEIGYFAFSTCQYSESWKILASIEVFNQLKSMFTESELKLALFEIHE